MSMGTLPRLQKGFTIVELLVVVTVIGILVTVAVVGYNGIQQNAKDKAVLSDANALDGLQTEYGLRNNVGGKDWYSGNGVDNDLNFTPSEGNIVDVVTSSTDYCIRVYNPGADQYNSLLSAATIGSRDLACSDLIPSVVALTAAGEDSGNWASTATTVSTFAGQVNSYGLTDGTGTAAQFGFPLGIAVDSANNVYVADSYNYAIRKITPAGVVTTLAGGSYGFGDGTGASATFKYPSGVAVDSANNVYVADSSNHAIRKITPAGVVTTIAGNGSSGFVDGTGSAARFRYPTAVTIDPSNNDVYIADSGSDVVRKMTPAGVVTTLAGNGSSSGFVDGTGSAARFNYNYGIVFGPDGNLYVGDGGNGAIRKVTPAGVVTTLAGDGTQGYVNGTGSAARFYYPSGLAFDSNGDLYVGDYSNNVIRKVTLDGVVTTFAGTGGAGFLNGYRTSAKFYGPDSIAIDSNDIFYITDAENYVIRKIE